MMMCFQQKFFQSVLITIWNCQVWLHLENRYMPYNRKGGGGKPVENLYDLVFQFGTVSLFSSRIDGYIHKWHEQWLLLSEILGSPLTLYVLV
jgi:hypothetical protein